MSGTKISDLPAATLPISPTSQIAVVQGEGAGETTARAALSTVLEAGADYGSPGVDLVAVAGQSNAMGAGWAGTITGGAANPLIDYVDARVIQYALSGDAINSWAQASEPLALSLGVNDAGDVPAINAMAAGRIGPWLATCKWLAQLRRPARRVGIVNTAVGGSGFGSGLWVAGNPGGTLYEAAIADFIAAYQAAGANARLAAYTWIQGENDAFMSFADYQANLTALITGFRTRLGAAGVVGADTAPFVIFGIVPQRNIPTNAFNVWGGDVMRAQRDMPRVMARVVYQEGPLGDATDIHYSAATLRQVSPLWAQVVSNAINVQINSDDTITVPTPTAILDQTEAGLIQIRYETPLTNARISGLEGRYRLTSDTAWSTATFSFSTVPGAFYRPQFTGLTTGQEYECQIRFTNGAGVGAWSNSVTSVVYALPGSPTNTAGAALSQTSILVEWDAPASGGAVTGYQVAWRYTSYLRFSTVTVAADVLSYTLTNLAPGTPYEIYIQAIGPAGTGYTAGSITVQTDAIIIPNTKAVTISNTRLGIFFDPPAETPSDYEGLVALTGSGIYMPVETSPGISRPVYLSGVTSNTAYDTRINALLDGVQTGQVAELSNVLSDNKGYNPTWSMWAPRGEQLDVNNLISGQYDQWGYSLISQADPSKRFSQAETTGGLLAIPAINQKSLQCNTGVPVTGDFTVVCLWNFDSVATSKSTWFVCPQFSGVTGRWWLWRTSANSGRLTLGWPSAGVVVAGTSPFVLGWNLFAWTFRRSDAYCELILNGTVIGTGYFPITTVGGPCEFNANGGAGSDANGHIGMVEMVQSRLTTADLQAEQTRLSTKYGITIG